MRFTSDISNFIGTHLLPFTNPRVVCPPGDLRPQKRSNIIVATPMRSGTHLLIDMMLNNVPALRTRPLYVDLDQCWKQSRPDNDLLKQVTSDAGYILKTHMPIDLENMSTDTRILPLLDTATVITIRRDRDAVCQSLARWHGQNSASARKTYEAQYDAFWDFWGNREQFSIAFEALFDTDRMQTILGEICTRTGHSRHPRFTGPPSGAHKRQIYLHKALTRIVGRHAPRIDTTIHTLKN